MDAHAAEPRRDGDGLVRDDPHFIRAPTVSLHRKTNRRAVSGGDTKILQLQNNVARSVIDLIAAAVELNVGDGARGRPDILAVHPADETDHRFRCSERAKDFRFLPGNVRAFDCDKADIVSTRFETEVSEPFGVDNAGYLGRGAGRGAGAHRLHGRMFGERYHCPLQA